MNDALKSQFESYQLDFSQSKMQTYLDSIYQQQDLTEVLEQLFTWSLQTGYLTEGKLYDNPHYRYLDPRTHIEYKTQVNIARSKYSPKPLSGKDIPKLHCPICFENIGIAGKENLRAFSFELTEGREFFIQYTPFPIFPYHIVIIDKKINPMIMGKQSIIDMLAFTKKAPQYVMLSNSDVVGAGASIISHHHYQAIKNCKLPIMQAKALTGCQHRVSNHNGDCQLALLNFPIACLKLTSTSEELLSTLAGNIIQYWKAQSPGKNTCNLLLHRLSDEIHAYILFRNPQHLTPASLQYIKSEYIGIIEVCGEGIYPVPTGDDSDQIWQQIETDGLNIIKGIIEGNNPIKETQYFDFFNTIVRSCLL